MRKEALVVAHLSIALQTAVPLLIHEIQAGGGVTEHDITRTMPLVEGIASHGDDVLYAAKKRGEAAKRLAQFARGIAILAFQPGGVDIFDLHFEAKIDLGQSP